jgi:iron complex transport system substrate-binding protein
VVVDAAGIGHDFTQPARRIISLVPSATTTLRAIGASDLLVGRTDFDTDAWVAERPSVGGGLDPSLEAIVALRPDLVIRFAGGQDPRTAGRLDDLGIPHLAVRPDAVEDVYEMTRLIGQATGHESAADSLVTSLQAGLVELAQAVAEWPRLRVAYVLGGSPPWVTGPGTYIDEVMSLAGGDNVFGDLDALYSAVSPEEFRTRKIDVVLVAVRGIFDESLAPGARIEEIGGALDLPGPGLVSAARSLAQKIHGRRLQ